MYLFLCPLLQGWLKDYFDEHSENIPSLGLLSSGFFGNFKSAAPAPSTQSAATGASGGAVVSDVSAAAERLNRKRTAQQMMSGSTSGATASKQGSFICCYVLFFLCVNSYSAVVG